MRIGVIGGGRIGGTAAQLFAGAGHDVAIANSRGPETLGELPEGVHGSNVEDAAAFGELLLVAIPFGRYDTLPAPPTGTIVLDAGNYYPDRDGNVAELDDDTTTSSELLAARLPDARVIKAFNTMYWEHLRDRSDPAGDDRLVIPLAGDDQEAKDRVAHLIEEIGFAAFDTGGLADGGRRQQPDAPLYGKLVTGSEARELLA